MVKQKDMRYITFNNNYFIKPDDGQALLLSALIGRNMIPGEQDGSTFVIHPIYAMILSCIDGREYDECVKDAAHRLDIPVELIENFVSALLDKEERTIFKAKNGTSEFPKRTIISIPEKNIDHRFSPEMFEYDHIDIRVKRHLTPSCLTLMVNNICVTDCIYCYEDQSRKVNCSIPLDRIIQIIHEAKRLYVSTFDVIGGEFFLYKHWKEVLKELRACGYHPYLSTKIPMTEEDVRYLAKLKIHDIQISVDTLIDEHLKPTLRVKDGYSCDMRNCLLLLQKYNIPVMIHTVLTKYNASSEDMSSIFSIIKDMPNLVDWHIVKADASLYPKIPYETFKVSSEMLNDTIVFLEQLKDESGLSIRFPQMEGGNQVNQEDDGIVVTDNQDKPRDFSDFFNRTFCSGLYSSLYILPDGNVTICEQLYWNKDFIVGNIMENSLEEIWNSDKANSIYYIKQEDIPSDSKCSSCEHFDVCRSIRQVCYREIVRKYGADKWYYPDPMCPFVR